ncbi:MAG: S4 domain-containing protein [Christensenellales bacterium]
MRLQKYMAMCGVAARRKCEEIIASGRVAVNGETITQMGTQVEEGDVVTLDGQVITPEEEKRYILYHKPAGEVTTVSDDKGRETVMDRFADFPCGFTRSDGWITTARGCCCSPTTANWRSGSPILPARWTRSIWRA